MIDPFGLAGKGSPIPGAPGFRGLIERPPGSPPHLHVLDPDGKRVGCERLDGGPHDNKTLDDSDVPKKYHEKIREWAKKKVEKQEQGNRQPDAPVPQPDGPIPKPDPNVKMVPLEPIDLPWYEDLFNGAVYAGEVVADGATATYDFVTEHPVETLQVVGGVAIIAIDIATVPSGEGTIGAAMIGRALQVAR